MVYPGESVDQSVCRPYSGHHGQAHDLHHPYASHPVPMPHMIHAGQMALRPHDVLIPQHPPGMTFRHPSPVSQQVYPQHPSAMPVYDLPHLNSQFQATIQPINITNPWNGNVRMSVPQQINGASCQTWPDIVHQIPMQGDCISQSHEFVQTKKEIIDNSYKNNDMATSKHQNLLVISPDVDDDASLQNICQNIEQYQTRITLPCSTQNVSQVKSSERQPGHVARTRDKTPVIQIAASKIQAHTNLTDKGTDHSAAALTSEGCPSAANNSSGGEPELSDAGPVDVDLSDDSEHSLTDLITNLGKVASYMRATLEVATPAPSPQKKSATKRPSKDPRQDIIKQAYKKQHKPYANGLVKKIQGSTVRVCKPRRYDISCFLQKTRYQSKRGKKLNDVMNTFSDLKLKRKSDTESLWKVLRASN